MLRSSSSRDDIAADESLAQDVAVTSSTLSRSNYITLLSASATSNVGDGISFVAIPLLATTLTRDPLLVAGTALAYSGARLLASPLSGTLADRTDRRRLMVVANLIRGAVLLALAALVSGDVATVWILYAAFVLLGIFETMVDVSAFALLPSVVGPKDLTRANGQLAGAQTILDEFVGPPLGGLLLGFAVALPVAVDAATFLLAALLVASMHGSFRPSSASTESGVESFGAELNSGLRYLGGNRDLLTLAASSFLSSVAYMAPFAVLALWATELIGLTPTQYGLLLTASAAGSLLGATTASRIEQRLGSTRTLRVMLGIGATSYVALALATDAVAVGLLLGIYFFHTSVWSICFAALRQRLIPSHLMGRVNGAMRSCGLLGLVVGAAVGGLFARQLGLQSPFWLGAGLLLIAMLLPLTSGAESGSAPEDASLLPGS